MRGRYDLHPKVSDLARPTAKWHLRFKKINVDLLKCQLVLSTIWENSKMWLDTRKPFGK